MISNNDHFIRQIDKFNKQKRLSHSQILKEVRSIKEKHPNKGLKKTMLPTHLIDAIQQEFTTWSNAKQALKIKSQSATDKEFLKIFKTAFYNKDLDKWDWRLQCKYAIDRFGSMKEAYKRANIKREHRDEAVFLKNFKNAFLNRKEDENSYKRWRSYSQKAFNRYRSLSTAYQKAGIK